MVSTQTKVATLAEMGERSSMLVKTDGRQIALFNVDGKFFATAARCPHANGPLVNGEICDNSLICPWHGWTYDIATGACEEDPSLTLKTYPVTVDGEDIIVAL